MVVNLLLVVLGLALLVKGADWLIDGAGHLALRFGLSPLVVGLTIVAFGTSAPEMAAAVAFALDGKTGTVTGTVVGSNIANLCLILGLTALVKPVHCRKRFLRVEVPLLMVVTVIAALALKDGVVSRLDAVIGLVLIVAYTLRGLSDKRELQHEVEEELGDTAHAPPAWKSSLLVALGVGLLVGGAKLLVDAVSDIALSLGVPEFVIGLTMVAFGTSLPELATSVRAALRGHSDIALGNVIGSNVFNLLAVLGLGGLIRPLEVPQGVIDRDLWIMLAATAALAPITLTGKRVNRVEGGLLVAAYLVYATALFLREHA